ncbi:NYN domain-containing protein, partial [Roseisolibacter sp. H3M3-2]|uniref:NYN domain-containing protein n=1 Tax=Roseisolibacter sp. H3M3-2 TaxID=3031323 RepID=UPI0023D9823F
MSSRFTRPPQRGPVAPIHRGPQALPPGTSALPGGYYNAHAPNAALLIDFDNVTMGIQKDMQSELRNLLSSDIIKGKVSVQRAYADWRRYPGYIVPLTEASIDLIFAPAYGSAKKNATDIRLAIDAMELVFTRPEIGTFILLSGDSDFSSLVIKLKEYGKYVIGVGIRESSSDLLVQNCDEYYSYNALAGLVRTSDEEVVRWDPWELVVEAVGRMVRNGDVMRADRLKQVMQDVDPSFDEKDLGMSKFSRFVHEAEKRGLLTLTRQENGQYEIGATARGAERAAAAPAAARAARGAR